MGFAKSVVSKVDLFRWVEWAINVIDCASPVGCADGDVHNPSAGGLRCGFRGGWSKVDGFRWVEWVEWVEWAS